MLLASSAALLYVVTSNSNRSDELIYGLGQMLNPLFSLSNSLDSELSEEVAAACREAALAAHAVARALSSIALDIKDSVGVPSLLEQKAEHIDKRTLRNICDEIGRMLDDVSYFDADGFEAEFDLIKDAMTKLHAQAANNLSVGNLAVAAADALVGKAIGLQRMIEAAIPE